MLRSDWFMGVAWSGEPPRCTGPLRGRSWKRNASSEAKQEGFFFCLELSFDLKRLRNQGINEGKLTGNC